jgi:hypothetical protein
MPRHPYHGDLTGARRHRVSCWQRKLILQVEEQYRSDEFYPSAPALRWRDARTRDLAELDWLDRRAKGENPPPPKK